jgi:hypothetical protein
MELRIYYLHYNTKNSAKKTRPRWFSYENCLVNLLETIKASSTNLKIRLILVFDGSEDSFYGDFSSNYFVLNHPISSQNLTQEVKLIKAGNQFSAANQLLDYAFEKDDYGPNDLIYTLENDYLHDYGWLNAVEDLLNSDIHFHYLSLYDHADKYRFTKADNGLYNRLKSKIYVTSTRHWRTTPSTCFSFISKATILKKDLSYFKRYRDEHVQKFLRLIKGRILVSPIPSFSTHCMDQYLAPLVDWESINNLANISKNHGKHSIELPSSRS